MLAGIFASTVDSCRFKGFSDAHPGRALSFVSGRYVRPGFLNLRACERINCCESGLVSGLSSKTGLENWWFIKFLSFFFCTKKGVKLELLELKKFCHIFGKLLILEAKFNIYIFQMRPEGLVNGLITLNWGSFERQERREKEVLRAAHPHTPFSGECPPMHTNAAFILACHSLHTLLLWWWYCCRVVSLSFKAVKQWWVKWHESSFLNNLSSMFSWVHASIKWGGGRDLDMLWTFYTVPYMYVALCWLLRHYGSGKHHTSRWKLLISYNFSSNWSVSGVQIRPCLRESNLIETKTFSTQFNEGNWFSYQNVTRILARIDSLNLQPWVYYKWLKNTFIY